MVLITAQISVCKKRKNGIVISEKDGKLQLAVMLKGNFRHHMDIYEDGEITDCPTF